MGRLDTGSVDCLITAVVAAYQKEVKRLSEKEATKTPGNSDFLAFKAQKSIDFKRRKSRNKRGLRRITSLSDSGGGGTLNLSS
jgi:hypothetical protein